VAFVNHTAIKLFSEALKLAKCGEKAERSYPAPIARAMKNPKPAPKKI
jgi:hypothetical protein